MEKNPLIRVYTILNAVGLAASQTDFSRQWLQRSESYLRGLRFNDVAPNIAVVAVCATKLEHVGEALLLKHPRSGVGERLLELSDECMDWIREQSRSQWQHKRGFRAQNPLLAV